MQELDEKVWNDMIKEADTDGDGEISYDEFIRMMHNLKEGSQIFAKVK